jgi:predicted GNAT family acetyltransferase
VTDVQVSDNPEKRRFEALVNGRVAGFLFYQERDGQLVLVHTQVGGEWEGQGVGSRLVSGALESIRERGLRMTPVCPFVRSYLERHPGYSELVAE